MDLTATLGAKLAYVGADYMVIAVPTNYDSDKNYLDTSAMEKVIYMVMKYASNTIMAIESTISIGYTKVIWNKTDLNNIILVRNF